MRWYDSDSIGWIMLCMQYSNVLQNFTSGRFAIADDRIYLALLTNTNSNTSMMNKDTYIGFPVYDGRVGISTMQEVFHSQHLPETPVKGVIYLVGDSLVTRARNKVVKKFLELGGEYLLFIDSDIVFTQSDIIRLRNRNKKIIGGVYLKKKLPYEAVCNRMLRAEGDLHVMAEVGTGFLMIHREVFEAIQAKYPEHFYVNEGDEPEATHYDFFRVGVVENRYLSEDYYFCWLARQCGYDVFYDTTILVKHEGKATYPMNDSELLAGATELLNGYDIDEPLDEKTLNTLQGVIAKQKKVRGYE